MPDLPVLICVPNIDLGKSLQFVLHAYGYTPILASSDSEENAEAVLLITDETVLYVPPASMLSEQVPTIVLSQTARPYHANPRWWWLEKSHLGEALQTALAEALKVKS
ncbi:MAG: hypothetical protein EOP84_15860 [Verrucomicrobiaceae bacterium]|nr:MAG: hypothetical protein EOP84_15860 [Verrucomicrobiaceae bacterium]